MEEQERDLPAEVAQIFTDAGWTAGTKDGWNGQFIWAGTVVGGIDPFGTPRVAGLTGPDGERPEVVASSRWLVEHAKQFAPVITTEATLEPPVIVLEQSEEPEESLGDESNGETGEARSAEAPFAGIEEGEGSAGSGDDDRPTPDVVEPQEASLAGAEVQGSGNDALPIDADFTVEDLGGLEGDDLDLPSLGEPEPEDFAPDEIQTPDDPSGAFIFGDNLHQLRTAAIGLVVQAALTRLPEPTDYAKLSELRNFAMGVSENRWPDDPAKRDELDAMEATERRRRAIEAARDEKVAFLVEATREQIEDFSPEAGWP